MPAAGEAVWVPVLPSMKGFGPALASGVNAPAAAAGKTAGLSFGKALIAGVAVVGAGVAAAGKALYEIGKTFDDVSDTIRVGTGATGDALKSLEDSAKNIGRNVPADFASIGTAVADLNTRLGLTGQPLEDMASQFLNLSRITGTDLSKNIKDVTRVFGDWGVAVEDQPAALDKIYRASQATGAGIDELSTAAVKFGAPMRQLGFSFDDTLALLGKFEKEGVNTNLVMGSMRIALGKMAKAGEEPVDTLARVTDQIKNAGSAGDANALALELFGARAGPDMAAAIREGRFEIDDLVDTIANGSDTISDSADDTADFSEQWQLFKNRAMLTLEPVAARVFKALTDGMTWINDKGVPAIRDLGEAFQRDVLPKLKDFGSFLATNVLPAVVSLAVTFQTQVLPRLQDFGSFLVGTVIPAVADFGGWLVKYQGYIIPVVGGIVAMIAAFRVYKTIIAAVRVATAAWAAVQAILNVVITANPIGIIILAVVGLVAALVIAYKRSETFRRIVHGALDAVAKIGRSFWDDFLKPSFDALVTVLTETWEAFKTLKRIAGDAISGFKNGVRDGVRAVVDFFLGMAESMLGAAETALGWMPGLGDKIKDANREFRKFRDGVNDALDGIDDKHIEITAEAKGILSKNALRFANEHTNRGRFMGGPVPGPGSGGRDNVIAPVVKGMRTWWQPLEGGEHVLSNREVDAAGGHGAIAAWRRGLLAGRATGGAVDFGVGVQPRGMGGFAKAMHRMDRALGLYAKHIERTVNKAAAAVAPVGANGWAFPLPRGSYRVGGGLNSYPGHTGQDFPAPTGTPVFSPISGNLQTIRLGNRSYGNYANITAGGQRVILAHLSAFTRGPGSVAAGEMVGRVGSTGNSTGPHLHAEVRTNGAVKNPRNFFTYDQGGWLRPGDMALNAGGKPEAVLTPSQSSALQRIASGGSGGPLVHIEHMSTHDMDEAARKIETRQRDAVNLNNLRAIGAMG